MSTRSVNNEVKRVVIQAAAAEFAYWLRWAETHCWNCNGERDYSDYSPCPHCQADVTPF